MTKFICTYCYKKLEVADDHVGKGMKCPRCGELAWVPAPSDPKLFPDEVFDQLDDSPFTGKKRCRRCRTVFGAEDFDRAEPLAIRQRQLAQLTECPQCGGSLDVVSGNAQSGRGCLFLLALVIGAIGACIMAAVVVHS